jgi:hypothetical protein
MNPKNRRNRTIFEKYQQGASISLLARKYGCSRQRIYQIVSNEATIAQEELRLHIGPRRRFVVPKPLERVFLAGKISSAKVAAADLSPNLTLLP